MSWLRRSLQPEQQRDPDEDAMPWDDRTAIESALASGVDDWLHLGWVVGIASDAGRTAETTRLTAYGVVAELLMRDWAVAGDADAEGFTPWKMPRGEMLETVLEGWLEWGEETPTPGAVCWLALTPEGKRRGEDVLRREGQL